MDPLPDNFQELLQDAVAASHMDDKNDLPLFMSDNFRIYCMKVRAGGPGWPQGRLARPCCAVQCSD